MARVCIVTGKRTRTGYKVSHSGKRTKRKFFPNLQKKRIYIPGEGRWVTVKISTQGLKILQKRGIAAVVRELRKKGIKI